MRWLAAEPGPAYSVLDVHNGWVEALRELGEQVIEYPLGSMLTFYDHALLEAGPGRFRKALTGEQATELATDRLCGALWKTRPDALLITSGFFVDGQVLDRARRDGVKVVVLGTESPYEDERQLKLAEHADVFLVDDPTNLGRFQAVTTAVYTPKAFRPSVHQPGPPDPMLACDLSFIGTGYPSRIELLEAMDLEGVDVLLAGNWQRLDDDSPLRRFVPGDVEECLDNATAAAVYRSTRVGLNLYRREAERPELAAGWSMGPRELEMAATGCFFLRDPRGEGDEVLHMLPRFTSPEEASALLRWYLDHPDQRAELAAQALAAVQGRTFDQSAATLLRLLDSFSA